MNTEEFLDAVKRTISVPTYQGRFSNDDFLAFANEEQAVRVVPMLTSVREEYLIVREDIDVTAGTAAYQIPRRASGATIRAIWFSFDGSNNYKLSKIDLTDAVIYENEPSGNTNYFYFRNDKVVLCPAPTADGTITLHYILSPSKIVPTSRTFLIDSLTDDTVTSLYPTPRNITTANGFNVVDITSYRPFYSVIVRDATVSSYSTTSVTLDGYTPTDTLADAGVVQYDVLSAAGETSILQLPVEIQTVLVHATAVRILQGLQVPDKLKATQELLTQSIQSANELLQPRAEGELGKVYPRNGLLNRSNYRRFPSVSV